MIAFTGTRLRQAGIALTGLMLFVVSMCWGQTESFTGDFEEGNLRGWEATGTAFRFQPTLGDNPTARNRGQPSNHQGQYWIGTYEKFQGRQRQKPGEFQGDEPVGTLTSMPFTIPRGTLEFLVGGGREYETRVELLIQDPIEGLIRGPYASGENSETMHRVSWDLAPYAGKTGRIRIVDNASGPWGHINADDFRIIPADIPATPSTVTVPDLYGLTVEQSAEQLERSGLHIGRVARKASDSKSDTVIEQYPPKGTEVRPDSRVALIVAEAGRQPVADQPRNGNPPPPPKYPKWIWFIPVLPAAWGVFRLMTGDRKGRKPPPTATIRMKPLRDSGTQALQPRTTDLSGPHVRLKPVGDSGRQEIAGSG